MVSNTKLMSFVQIGDGKEGEEGEYAGEKRDSVQALMHRFKVRVVYICSFIYNLFILGGKLLLLERKAIFFFYLLIFSKLERQQISSLWQSCKIVILSREGSSMLSSSEMRGR